MRIHFERTGGIAGMRINTTIDTRRLPDEEAQEVEKLVESSGFFELPADIRSASADIDRFRYHLTVESGKRSHTVVVGDAAAPDDLRPLLRKLSPLARKY